jgi:hypothetical protein
LPNEKWVGESRLADHVGVMDDDAFDRALIAAVFEQAAVSGWARLSIAQAAGAAGLDLGRARLRVPSREAALIRFGRMADAAALSGASTEGPVRDRLFDIMMRRIDALQAHRAGVLALLRWLPSRPGLALALAALTKRSMGWMLEGAGISALGPLGELRARAMVPVWLWTVRAWQRDDSADLSATMASLDSALRRVERLATLCGGARSGPATAEPPTPPTDTGPEAPPSGAPPSAPTPPDRSDTVPGPPPA